LLGLRELEDQIHADVYGLDTDPIACATQEPVSAPPDCSSLSPATSVLLTGKNVQQL
jgi:hypothetical protein